MPRNPDDDNLVYAPEPEPPEDPMFRDWRKQWERDEKARQMAEARQKEAFERRTRNYKVKPGGFSGEE